MPLASALRLSVTLCSVPSQRKRQAVFFMFQLSSVLSIANSIQGHRLAFFKEELQKARANAFSRLNGFRMQVALMVPMVTPSVSLSTSFKQAEVLETE